MAIPKHCGIGDTVATRWDTARPIAFAFDPARQAVLSVDAANPA